MKKVIRLTESQLTDLIEKVINQSQTITEKWEGDVEVKSTGQYSDMTIEELDAAIKRLKSQNDKYQEKERKFLKRTEQK